jgi:hypothetical protein
VFKLGLYRPDQVKSSSLNRHRVSFHLLRGPDSPDQVRLFESLMPQIRLSNGVFRTTSRARFHALDRLINGLLAKHFESSRTLDIHDWAASDCAASAEWAGALWSCFPNARVTASDLILFLLEAALPNSEMFILEPGGEPLQYIRPPFVVRFSPPEHRLMFVNRILAWHGRAKLRHLRGAVVREISLIHPVAEALRVRSDKFAIVEHSAFTPLEQPCDVVRTMNIFNLQYFSAARLEEGIEVVKRSLLPGGIWIVGRTIREDPPVHDASILMKEGDRFRLLERHGRGSEVEPLIPM